MEHKSLGVREEKERACSSLLDLKNGQWLGSERWKKGLKTPTPATNRWDVFSTRLGISKHDLDIHGSGLDI